MLLTKSINIISILISAILVAFIISPFIIFGENSAVLIYDSADGVIPSMINNANNYIKYGLTYWQPTMMGGFDGFSQGYKFTGINQIIYLISSPILAYKIIVILYSALSLSGFYFLLRHQKCPPHPSFLIAVIYFVFSFSPNLFLIHNNMSFAFLPYILLAIAKIIKKKSKTIRENILDFTWLFLLGFISLSTFVSEPLTLPQIGFIVFCYFILFHDWTDTVLRTFISVLIFVLGISVNSTAMYVAVNHNAKLSQKGELMVQKHDLLPKIHSNKDKEITDFRHAKRKHPHDKLCELRIPLNICGLQVKSVFLCLFLAFVGWLLRLWYEKKFLRSFCDLAFLCLPSTIIMLYSLVVSAFNHGTLKAVRIERFNDSYFIFILLFLSRYFVQSPPGLCSKRCIYHRRLVHGSLVIIVLLSFYMPNDATYRKFNGIIDFDLSKYGTQKELYDSSEMREISRSLKSWADGPFRVATIAEQNIFPGFIAAYGNETIDGYDFLVSQRFIDFWREMVKKYIKKLPPDTEIPPSHTGYLVLNLLPGALNKNDANHFFSDSVNLNMLRLGNVYYVFSPVILSDEELILRSTVPFRRPLIDSGIIGKFAPDEVRNLTLYVYELKDPFPRYYSVFTQRCFQNTSLLLEAIGKASSIELSSEAFLLDTDCTTSIGASAKNSRADIQIKSNTPDEIILKADFQTDGILVSLNNYHPDWKAEVDKSETKIFPVYHTFNGIVVQKGVHEIKMSYRPGYKKYFFLEFLKRNFNVSEK
ncbi:MAG: hypothetical protein HQL77_18880 [Magnetococcales bacterium]|nr:hypothetical protein [Magnetococcales bacterium]